MRVHIYEEEQTEHVEIVDEIPKGGGPKYYGVRFYLHSSERLHHDRTDDDRSAITFWAKDKGTLRLLLERGLDALKSK